MKVQKKDGDIIFPQRDQRNKPSTPHQEHSFIFQTHVEKQTKEYKNVWNS